MTVDYKNDGSVLDQWVQSKLMAGGYISRRSMVGRSIGALLALAGVAIVPRKAPAAVGFASCSELHGHTCAGKCTPNNGVNTGCKKSDTTQILSGWVGCCELAAGQWSCLNLYDWLCQTLDTPANLATCAGVNPTGRVWFGGDSTWTDPHGGIHNLDYLCTDYINVTPGTTYATWAACADKCAQINKDSTDKNVPNSACTNWCQKTCTFTWDGSKWTTADTCAGDRSSCVCSTPINPGTVVGQKQTTNCYSPGA
jgi:hypothetical protein